VVTLTVLGSGSSGNASVISDGETRILLDCGFSARETARRMALVGLDPSAVTAVLVTHEHGDHVSGVPVFARRFHVPIFLSEGTARASTLPAEKGCDLHRVHAGETIALGTLKVTAFKTSHDAAEPLGYVFEAADGARLGVATDTGVVTGELLEALAGCEVVGLETNHDPDMLENGPYPYFLRKRIAGSQGHLSNQAAAAALERLAHDGLRRVVGMHVSQQNNLPRLATAALSACIARIGLDVEVAVAKQHEPLGGEGPKQERLAF
jgi:phosphoribosyl 1,2-cyclic phosphodiesterase